MLGLRVCLVLRLKAEGVPCARAKDVPCARAEGVPCARAEGVPWFVGTVA